jgi:hypothetical protein
LVHKEEAVAFSPEYLFRFLAWLGGAFFCGIAPLGIAAILFFSSRKRGQTEAAVGRARLTKAAEVQLGAGLVRLQGRIAPRADPIDGSPDNALVYLRLKIEVYDNDSEDSGWKGLTEKARGIPFQLDDGTGAVWVNPEGLDKHLLGNAVVPDDNQAQAACILLGISPKMLRGQLRFSMWELRAGQVVTVVGTPVQGQGNLLVARAKDQPLIVSPLLGQTVDARITAQKKSSQTWTLILGIPGVLLLCGLGGALVALIGMLTAK